MGTVFPLDSGFRRACSCSCGAGMTAIHGGPMTKSRNFRIKQNMLNLPLRSSASSAFQFFLLQLLRHPDQWEPDPITAHAFLCIRLGEALGKTSVNPRAE